MKREIKFRGKCFETGGWVEGSLAIYPKHYPTIMHVEDDYPIPKKTTYVVLPETVGQFTEKTDKNGREIYEGDIILVRGLYHRVVLWDKMSFALMPCEFYHDKTFWVMNLQHPSEDWWSLFADKIEIIGNIHDNPDLLKGGNQ